jgi:predicted MFS family arabinose efflux permease
MPLIVGGVATGVLLAAGGYAPGVAAVAICLLLSGVAGSLISVAGTISVFHGFPADRRGAALGVRQMSVAAGGLVAAILLPGLASIGGVGLALAVSGALTAVTGVVFGLASPAGALAHGPGEGRTMDVAGVLRIPGMVLVLVIGFVLVSSLTAVTTFIVPAGKASGLSSAGAEGLFVAVSLAAMASRIAFGRIADLNGGRRRRATLRDVALIGSLGSLVFWAASGAGLVAQIPAVAVLAFGTLGFNGIVYAIAGELTGPRRAGQAVGLASTVLFGGSAIAAVPLGALADAAGYRALWPASALLCAVGALLALRLPPSAARLP